MTQIEKQIMENPDDFKEFEDETFKIMRESFNNLWDEERSKIRESINDPKYQALRNRGY